MCLLLEIMLGVALFELSRSGSRPTAAGALFIREASFGAEQLRQAIAEVTAGLRGGYGVVRVGIMTSLADGFLGAALARFHARYPNIDVKLEEATAQMNVAGVISGRLDIAFVPGVPEPEGCRVETLPDRDRMSTRLDSSHYCAPRMASSP